MPEEYEKLSAYLAGQGCPNANIELILSRVRALADVVGMGNLHGLDRAELAGIERLICAEITGVMRVDLPVAPNGYRDLVNWIGGFERTHAVELFTTNYDLLCEDALESARLTYFDGFTGAKRPFFDLSAIERDQLPPHWTRLWKLHGSINWRESEGSSDVCRVTDVDDQASSMIHPSHRKYDQSRRLPYLALIDRLKAFLRSPSAVLVVSGYSFGDEHLNEVLVDALEKNPTGIVLALMYGPIGSYPELERLACKRANLTVLSEDFGIVGTKRGCWNAPRDTDLASLRSIFADGTADLVDWVGGDRRCVIGDFAALGEFLGDVSGNFSQVERAARS